MIELDEEETKTESKVIFDTDEEFGITIRRSAYTNLWADQEGHIYRITNKGGIFGVKTYINNAGYKLVQFRKDNGKYTATTVQRVVATAWIPNPQHLSDVDHIDDDRLNNAVSNLQWLSHRDNLRKCHRSYSLAGPKSPVTGRKVIKVSKDGTTKTYHSISAAARDNHLSFSSVRGSANHQLALDRPYYFEFAQEAK
jgi:hypothetical protein